MKFPFEEEIIVIKKIKKVNKENCMKIFFNLHKKNMLIKNKILINIDILSCKYGRGYVDCPIIEKVE